MGNIYIRLLKEEDTIISWRWRNDPEVWKYTGNKPNKAITYEIELEWIQNVLKRNNEVRFAICETESGKYIGNVQLTNINGYDAELHIFIGAKENRGKGYGTEATKLLVEYGLGEAGLQSIYLDVKQKNIAAIKAYQKSGFSKMFDYDEYHRMAIYETDITKKKVSVFVMTYNHDKFIAEALDGMVMQQTNFDIDIVLGDDFSTDNTRKIILEYAIKNPGKFKLLFYPKNISAAVNQIWVLKNCSGKYIALCEGDDFWTDPYKLQKQVDFLEANEEYVICFHRVYELHDGKSPELSCLNVSEKEESYTITDLARGNFIHTPSVVFRNGLIKEFPWWFKDSPVGDYLLYMLNAKSGRLKYFPQPMATYRRHEHGNWSAMEKRFLLEKWFKVIDLLLSDQFDEPVLSILRAQKRNCINEYLQILIEENFILFLEKLKVYLQEDNEIANQWATQYFPEKVQDLQLIIYSLETEISNIKKSRSYRFFQRAAAFKKKLFLK
jgi:RimJ/RimL family protein N-acetyltransferase/glycosyltransferase involved in cell wall biosynthesis